MNEDINLDHENTRRMLIAKREAAKADSEIGHRCSNLIELLKNIQGATGDQRDHITKSIKLQMTELAELEARNKAQGE